MRGFLKGKGDSMRNFWILLLLANPAVFGQSNTSTPCHAVSGAISTNFVDPSDTLGTATGDFKGGLGVHVLSVTPGPNGTTVLHNHHHWVTEAGDTILFDDADAVLFPTPIPGLYAASYTQGVKIIGGTGRFNHATGNLTTTYGAVDLTKGEVVLRYEGKVCFAPMP
jgi:hypothetical protein